MGTSSGPFDASAVVPKLLPRRLTCVLCGCEKDEEFFDGWRSCIGAPGLSGKVDVDRPECDRCDVVNDFMSVTTKTVKALTESLAGLVRIEEKRRG